MQHGAKLATVRAPRGMQPPLCPLACAVAALPCDAAARLLVPAVAPVLLDDHPVLGAANRLERCVECACLRERCAASQNIQRAALQEAAAAPPPADEEERAARKAALKPLAREVSATHLARHCHVRDAHAHSAIKDVEPARLQAAVVEARPPPALPSPACPALAHFAFWSCASQRPAFRATRCIPAKGAVVLRL